MGSEIRDKRGLTPVISSIILCAAVLVIGAGVWSVTYSASSIMQSHYYEEVMESVDKIKERFYIENIGFDNTSKMLKIWVYNYGKIDINVTLIRIRGGGNVSNYEVETFIPAGELVRVDVAPNEVPLASVSISVEVKSKRGNKAYDSIFIP